MALRMEPVRPDRDPTVSPGLSIGTEPAQRRARHAVLQSRSIPNHGQSYAADRENLGQSLSLDAAIAEGARAPVTQPTEEHEPALESRETTRR